MSSGLESIQTLVFTGYHKTLPAARFLLLRVTNVADARASLASLVARGLGFGKPERGARPSEALQIAFTAGGLAHLGFPAEALHGFDRSFLEGIETDHRKRVLGDEGDNDPSRWAWRQGDLDAVVFAYARTPAALDAHVAATTARLAGWALVRTLDAVGLADDREHFGFRDGIAQPRFALKPEAEDTLPLGEFVLGYPDLGDQPLPRRHADDLRQDGSYLVLRQLQQDVPAFWEGLRKQAGGDEERAVWLAAKMLGRWPNGMPLAPGPSGPMPPLPTDGKLPEKGELSYADDPRGLGCPRGSHVRRANPRDALGDPMRVRRHRILRRGRSYGLPAPASVYPPGVTVTADAGTGAPEAERGLLFACLCADLSRQFELIQQTWLNNPKHDGLFDEVDPIASGQKITADGRRYTVPEEPVRCRMHEVPFTVRVRGGAYLFLPGKAALARIAGG